MNGQIPEQFKGAMYDVEHALGMYAYSYCILPAEAIYEEELLVLHQKVIQSCHIYMIGLLPNIEIEKASQKDGAFILTVSMLGRNYDLAWPIPNGAKLQHTECGFFLENESGEQFGPSQEMILQSLTRLSGGVPFEVQYIGQAYGQDGARNAIDRLRKHETLQKISLKGIPNGFHLSILLLEIQPNNQLFTVFNPWAEKRDEEESSARIEAGFNKIRGTTEQEQVALYEAALIRYFYPKYNKIFKDSFPSTNLRILRDCYEKDFSAVIAEICFDDFPFSLYSDSIKLAPFHIVRHHLHEDSARRVFFGMDWTHSQSGPQENNTAKDALQKTKTGEEHE